MPSATGNDGTPPEMSEARLLAPWHAAGTLSGEERRELELLAKEDPEFALLLEGMGREARETVLLNESLGEPSQAVWERLSQSVAEAERAQSRSGLPVFLVSFKERAAAFLDGITKPQWQAVAAFALALCVIQAGVLVSFNRPAGTGKFSVASGPASGAKAASAFIVSFDDKAAMGEITGELSGIGAIIIDGPNAEGLYHLGLRDDTVQARDQAFNKLRSLPAVRLVLREN